MEWYSALNKPAFTPPGWVFGPAWTALYIMMAVAAILVWRRGWHTPGVRLGLVLFAVQLVLNLSWSPVFFGLHQLGWSVVIILALLAAIIATTIVFFRVSAAAGALFVPYLLWVSFATVLNITIWRMN
ncbi:MAG: TspO/MBR family protein [Armatimonadota bacterium]